MCEFCDNTYTLSDRQRIQLGKELNIDGVVGKVISQLFSDGKVDDATGNNLFVTHYEPLKKAVEEGYGKPIVKVEFGTPNYEFLKQLQTNTATFAMFKSHASVKDMAALLKDQDGNLRSREAFKREALKVDANYRGNKLDAEYDTAVRSSRMAANWQKYQASKKLYPNLKYIRTKAAKPDKDHLAYVGIIRPIDDAFWNAHYPPNRWRCQCSVEPTDEGATDIPGNLPPVPAEFAFNSGKTGQVFDINNSDYIKSVPAKQQPALIRDAEKYVDKDILKSTPYQPFYKSKTGNEVEVHPAAYNNSDVDTCAKYARELANLKDGPKKIQILPDLYDKDLRQQFLPDAKGNKNPDYRIDSKLFDLKNFSNDKPGTSTIQNAIKSAHQQCDGAVLIIPEGYAKDDAVYNMINQKLSYEAYKDFELHLKLNGAWQKFTWNQWQEFYKGRAKK